MKVKDQLIPGNTFRGTKGRLSYSARKSARTAATVHIGGDKLFLIEGHLKEKPRRSSNIKQDIVQLCLD